VKKKLLISIVCLVTVLSFVIVGCAPKAKVKPVEPIVMGYVGQLASPGVMPSIEAQKVAVKEINEAGGILGRPIKYLVEDSKRETSLAIAAATRLILEDKVLVLFVEGSGEINIAVQPKAAELYQMRPFIAISNGAVEDLVTERVLDDYEKYKFWFNDYRPSPNIYGTYEGIAHVWKLLGFKKIAWLCEDLEYTKTWRFGDPKHPEIPPLEKFWKERFGIDVVYKKWTLSRQGMYLPIFEEIAKTNPDLIFYSSSWYTDIDVFTKQWAESACKDIPIQPIAGLAMTPDYFWRVTGGKGLGVLSIILDTIEHPFTPQWVPFIKKAKEHGIPAQAPVHVAYADIYAVKAAIEKVGNTEDVEAIIHALEEVEVPYSMGRWKVQMERVKPYFHAKIITEPTDLYKFIEGGTVEFVGQYQAGGKVALLTSWAGPWAFSHPENYKTPAELRKMAAGK